MTIDIDSCKYIFLRMLHEPEENALRIVIDEARADAMPEDIEILGTTVSASVPIEVTEASRAFELVWDTYVAYGVRNETFCVLDSTETWEGRLFCQYSRSHFLEYVTRATIARDDYPGPIHHWTLNCLNHVVDIASCDEPTVRLLPPGE